ncbi:hypothetical protein TWF730_005376 [Orbilia blumenaviensis]|uniref:Uncharacterized protein n=1 Tax=Orbilia blumenaviensis TaxID=1796055 RepID=A0AAV9VKK8_9PEZI
MRCLKPRHSLVLCRRCALSTSCIAQASALRIDTHSATGVSVDSSIRPISENLQPEVWLAYQPPLPPSAPLRLAAPRSVAPVEEKVLGISYLPRKGDIMSVLSTRTVNGLAPVDGFLLSSTNAGSEKDKDPVSERILNLGKTIDILKNRLPTLLQSPLPSEILSPSITLQLFPSTHPHLPSVRGRMAYIAALWTSPVVWGRIPGIKVRLEILSIRMIKGGVPAENEEDGSSGITGERMIVKWRASDSPNGNGNGNGHGDTQSAASTSPSTPQDSKTTESKKEDPLSAVVNSLPRFTLTGDFDGMFIFEFDDKGRIKTHIIEDVEEDREEAVQQHSKVITLTEWLLKKAKKSLEDKSQMPGLAFERIWDDSRAHKRFG